MDRETKWMASILLMLGLLGLLVGGTSLWALQQAAGEGSCQALCALEQVFAAMVGPRISQLLVGTLWLLVGGTLTSSAISVWRGH